MNNKETSFSDGNDEIIPVYRRRVIRRSLPPDDEKPDITVFHEKVKASGAYEHLSERERTLMEAYFTTSAAMEDLRPLAGGVSRGRVRAIISHGLLKLYAIYLPQEMREEYTVEVPGAGRMERRIVDFKLPNKRHKRKG